MSPEHAALLADLVRRNRVAALGTIHDGAPYVSMAPFAILSDGSAFVIHVSRLAAHTGDMMTDPRVSLMVMQSPREDVSAQALARVSVQGVASMMANDSDDERECRDAYLERFPEARPLTEFRDFSFFSIRAEKARFVAGFAQAMTVSAETLAATLRAD